MNPGILRHRITLERPVTIQSTSGAEVLSFEPDGEEPASVEPLQGTEALQAAQIAAELDTKITIRWSPWADQITPKWRIQFRNVIYNITQVRNVEMRDREIVLLCSSGVNRG